MTDSTDDVDWYDEPEKDYQLKRKPKLHTIMFNLPVEKLIEKCEASPYEQSNKVISIIQYYLDTKKLSEKQRWVLAYFAAYGNRSADDQHNDITVAHKTFDDEDVPF